MKVKIFKPCGIGGTHVSAGDIVDVTKEGGATLCAYGLAAEATEEEVSASKKGKRGGE